MEDGSKTHVGIGCPQGQYQRGSGRTWASARALDRQGHARWHDVNKLLKVLDKVGTVEQLHGIYQAGSTGFGLQRALKARGCLCEIIAPSQIPRRAGERIKTGARDSVL
jgi:transposase